jgi:hypothetical protein
MVSPAIPASWSTKAEKSTAVMRRPGMRGWRSDLAMDPSFQPKPLITLWNPQSQGSAAARIVAGSYAKLE